MSRQNSSRSYRFGGILRILLSGCLLLGGLIITRKAAAESPAEAKPFTHRLKPDESFSTPLVTRFGNENRAEPTRTAQSSSSAGSAARADQIRAIREAYGASTGPITYNIGAGLDFEFNDNVLQTNAKRKSDFILGPQMSLTAFWGITELNTLSVHLTAGYSYYLDHNELSDFFFNTGFAPGSQIDLQIFVGDFVITIFDKLAYSSSPFQVIQNSGDLGGQRIVTTSDYGRLLNTVGLEALWDLNDLVLVVGFEHFNYWSFGDSAETQDRVMDELSGAARFSFSPAVAAGFEGGLSRTTYTVNFQNDSVGYSVGPFVEWQPTERTRLRLMGGMQERDFSEGGLNGDLENLSTWYGAVQINQSLTDWFKHKVEVGREVALGTNTNFSIVRFIRHRASWDVIRNWDLSTEIGCQQSEDSAGLFAAETSTFIGTVNLARMIMKNLRLIVRYQYVNADSNDPLQSFEQNLLRLSLYYNY